MIDIPFKALCIGAENKNLNPVKYNKSRISGSKNTTYNLHTRGVYMPGNKEIFTPSSKTKSQLDKDLYINQNMSAFQKETIKTNHSLSYKNYLNQRQLYAYLEYAPNDDDTLVIALNTLYRHIFGNLFVMDSEKPIDIERRLRNGDITIKECTRQLCKSNYYRKNYFENINQYKSIKLRYKHILGRPIIDPKEVTDSSKILNNLGFETHIDWLIDSDEYDNYFGEDTAPYMRSWNLSKGLKTKSFLETSYLTKAFATSDNCEIN